jgi:hypothetical protein
MEDSESLNEAPELCRMCMDDLTEVSEYFSINQDLYTLIEMLTGISVCFFPIFLIFFYKTQLLARSK